MRRILLVASVLLTSVLVNAQENPKYELFAGYSLQHNDGLNASGWEASGAYNFNRWIGMKLDADGHYFSSSSIDFANSVQWHTLTIGPQFSWRGKRAAPFFPTLFGISHENERQRVFVPIPGTLPPHFNAARKSFSNPLWGGG